MKRKLVLVMSLTLLVGVLNVALNIQPVESDYTWTEPIYIRADGSIDPPTAPISTIDNVTYILTGNITSDADYGIVVQRSNVITDGAGYTVRAPELGTGAYSKGLVLSGRSNVTIKNLEIKTFYYGIQLSSSNNNSISGNNITNNGYYGIDLIDSSNNTLSGNNITNNEASIHLQDSVNNNIHGNNMNNNGYGIVLAYSYNNTIYRNSILNNSKSGILIVSSSNNNISENNVTNNGWTGIDLAYSSNDNDIYGNHVANNRNGGISLSESSNNSIYHNSFVNNAYQVYTYDSVNVWDDGYPSGGNYWSDYAGVDEKKGPNQNLPGSDGIGDTPYVIDDENQDRYPLMHPLSPLPVHNINTGLGYTTIQEAINANETQDGHTIFVEAGTYYENVVVNKTLSLIGENREATIIDGNGSGDAVTVLSNDTSLSSFTLQAPGFMNRALRLENVSSTTIVDNTLTNSFSSVLLVFSDFNIIRDNNIAPGNYYSIFHNSSHNTLTRNSIGGLMFSGSFNNTLAENAIEAFWLDFSPNTKLRDNNFSYFEVGGDMDLHFIHDIDSSNMLNEKPIYYWVNRENAEIPSNAGYVALVNSTNITARNLTLSPRVLLVSTRNSQILSNNITEIWINSSSNNTISGNSIANGNEGIYLAYSSNNTISENNITSHSYNIHFVQYSNNNRIYRNRITDSNYPIYISKSSNNTLLGNNITNNWEGVYLGDSSGNIVRGNIIRDNGYGIFLSRSLFNVISENNITNNEFGMHLWSGSSNNTFYHNNFVNTHQISYSPGVANVWDNGYPSGGNYWSDYLGIDANEDGIGDTPHRVANNTDRFPLMGPFNTFDAGTWNGTAYNVDVVSNSTVSGFHFNPEEGPFLKFNVTGEEGTVGFCRVTIPKGLLWVEDGWTILAGNESITDCTIFPDENYTYLYFTYNHSTKAIVIQGTHVIPEFPSFLVLSLFMIATLLAVIVYKRKHIE